MRTFWSMLRASKTTDSGRGNGMQRRRTCLDARTLLVCIACCPFILLAIGVTSYADFQIQSMGGPSYLATVYSPCEGYAAMFPTQDGRYTGDEPDFAFVSLIPISVNGADTWELKVLGLGGTACRPAKTFRLATPSEYPEGDYCMLIGGCAAGTAAVFIP